MRFVKDGFLLAHDMHLVGGQMQVEPAQHVDTGRDDRTMWVRGPLTLLGQGPR